MSNFKSDLAHRIKKIKLKEEHCLLPLFEAIVNSIHAIEELSEGNKTRKIEIFAQRLQQKTFDNKMSENESFEEFYIKDSGVGFNLDNYKSFTTADSSYKELKGCKGVGRLSWLVAFDKVEIESNYQNPEGKWECRNFVFDENGTNPDPDAEAETSSIEKFETTVKLIGFKRQYQSACTKDIEILSRKIVDHCLLFFLGPNCPIITLEDNFGPPINLNDYFNKEIEPTLSKTPLSLKGKAFHLYHTRKFKDANKHELRFCANQRDVTGVDLSNHILNLQKRITPPGNASPFYYAGYLMGDFLDSNVDSERVTISFSQEEEKSQTNLNDFGMGDSVGHGFTQKELINSTIEYIESYLSEHLEKINDRKKEFIINYIRSENPKYLFLLNNKPNLFDVIPAGLSEDKLELELHKELIKWENEVKEKGEMVKKNIKENVTKTAEYQEIFMKYCKSITDINKISLAEYVIRRKSVLDILESSLEIDENGNYKSEDSIHSIICPLKYTSDEIEFDEMNLWIIDERLAYHNFLASDKQLRSLPVIDSNSFSRPDIAIFDQAISFAEGDVKSGTGFDSITVIEFKKPNRDGLDTEKTNPINQVLDYVTEIRAGNEKKHNGRPIGGAEHIPFYCYVIGDLTESMRKAADRADLNMTADSERYYGYHKKEQAYIEVISYSKLLDDAKKRNRIFFDKLFTPRVDQIFDKSFGDKK
jgi:hypothetical protein